MTDTENLAREFCYGQVANILNLVDRQKFLDALAALLDTVRRDGREKCAAELRAKLAAASTLTEEVQCLIKTLYEQADVLDGGMLLRTCSVHASARADVFRQIASELKALLAASPAEMRKEGT